MKPHKSPTLLRARKAVRNALGEIPSHLTPVVALSGGADSHALAFAAQLEGVKLAHIIDHGIQEITARVAQDTKELVEARGMTAVITRVELSTENSANSGGLENAARDARYAALLADPAHAVMTAHTLRDQAETVLMGFGRGSGARSIQGMKQLSQDGRLVRPFLNLPRSDMEAICDEFDLPYWNDPHNVLAEYRRVRVRTELLPLMEDILGGGVTESLARTAESLQEETDFIDRIAAASYTVNCKELNQLDPVIRRRVIRSFLLSSGADSGKLSQVHILEVEKLVTSWRGQKGINVPGLVVGRKDGELIIK